MNHFINKLIERHHSPEKNVKPRPQMRFENNSNDGFVIQDEFKEKTIKQNSKITKYVQKAVPKPEEKTKNENNVKANSIKTEKKIQTDINKNYSKEAPPNKEIPLQNNFVKPSTNFINKPNSNQIRQISPLKEQPVKEANNSEIGATNIFTNSSRANHFTDASTTNNNNINQTDEINNRFFATMNQDEKQPENKPALPTIKVNIGKIEIRANVQQKASPKKIRKTTKPKLTLEDYLNK